MPRASQINRAERKRGKFTSGQMISATKKVLTDGMSLRAAASLYGMCHVTLSRYVAKVKQGIPIQVGYNLAGKIFSVEQEKILEKYLIEAGTRHSGLCPMSFRKLAYQLAKKYELEVPAQWEESECATRGWFTRFLQRNRKLSIRKPQATSVARATSFNHTTVNDFFDRLENVIEKFDIDASRIYNFDETGIKTIKIQKLI